MFTLSSRCQFIAALTTQENLALFDFELDAGDVAKLEAINQQPRYERSVTGPDA
jgi:diketogulonate reductase-like aldo/keto reductase